MPKISVIVPVYKVEKYIHRCVDSILGQTFRDFELILVDDGSPDNCGTICDEYAAKDNRVVVIHQQNSGLSAARNAGIDWSFANSDSQWLTFVDSDDWIHPQMLEHLLRAATDSDVSVSMCSYCETEGAINWNMHTDTLAQVWPAEDLLLHHLVNATIAWGKLYKKTCFDVIRYPIGKLHEDEFVTYRILFEQKTMAFLPMPLYAYFVNNLGITKSNWTPRRMDALDAKEEQIAFYQENGCTALEERIVRDYARNLLAQYKQYQEKPIDRSVTARFRRKANWFLKHFRRYYQKDSETKIQLFWVVHPLLSRVYHIIKHR